VIGPEEGWYHDWFIDWGEVRSTANMNMDMDMDMDMDVSYGYGHGYGYGYSETLEGRWSVTSVLRSVELWESAESVVHHFILAHLLASTTEDRVLCTLYSTEYTSI
jgi:hypothetical protein